MSAAAIREQIAQRVANITDTLRDHLGPVPPTAEAVKACIVDLRHFCDHHHIDWLKVMRDAHDDYINQAVISRIRDH